MACNNQCGWILRSLSFENFPIVKEGNIFWICENVFPVKKKKKNDRKRGIIFKNVFPVQKKKKDGKIEIIALIKKNDSERKENTFFQDTSKIWK